MGRLAASLTRPDDGTLLVLIIKVVAWRPGSSWPEHSVELVATLRGSNAPHVPGSAWTQLPARQLIAASALLRRAHQHHPARPEPAFHPAPTCVGGCHRPTRCNQPARGARPAAADLRPRSAAPHTVTHTVRRGESLWSIAADHLGAGERYTEIVALNRRLLGGNPHFLRVVPPPAARASPRRNFP